MSEKDSHPNLRHRRNKNRPQHDDGRGEELADSSGNNCKKDLKVSSNFIDNENNRNHTKIYNNESSSSSTDDYILIPLRQRSIITRLDVGPFLVCYIGLVSLDYYNEYRPEPYWISMFTFIAFPVVLLIHLGLFLVQQWTVSWRAIVGYQQIKQQTTKHQWTHCLVEAPHVDKHHSSHDAEITKVTRLFHEKGDGEKQTESSVVVVNFQDIIFRCPLDQEEDTDTLLWSIDTDDKSTIGATTSEKSSLSNQSSFVFHRLKYPIHYPLLFYNQWRGHTSIENVLLAQQTYGTNTTNIDLPPFIELLQEQVVAPFFLFQVFCVLLWSLDEYWYYAMFTFFALLMFESTVAYNRLKSLQRLRSYTVHSPKLIWAYRPSYPLGKNEWVQISVTEMVPGDLVSCKQITLIDPQSGRQQNQQHKINIAQKQQQLNRVPADILILNGDAVVDESLLTGESIPQLKMALETDNNSNTELDLQEHKQSVLFGGTTLVVSHSGDTSLSSVPEPPDQGAVGVVLRTGFETAQGSLLRTMAHTQKSIDGIHSRDTYVFILLLLCCAIASAAMVWDEGRNDPTRNKFRLCLHVIIIVTSVVPPELPMELSLAVTNSVADLMKKKIFCTEVFRIPLAGQVNVCCFDKTGTLTSDEMQLKGLRLLSGGNSQEVSGSETNILNVIVEPSPSLPWPALRVMVACHSLAVNKQSRGSNPDSNPALIGDPLEKAVLEKTGYSMMQNNALVSEGDGADRPKTIMILQRFGFTSKLMRMSVLARESNSDKTWVLTKGAPETLKLFLRKDLIPSNYDQIAMHHMALGERVLAMAYKELDTSDAKSLKDIDRHIIESDLIFAGFLLLHCPIKHDSKSVVTELRESGNKVVMITGDAILTAAEVARQVGIIPKSTKAYSQIMQLQYDPPAMTTKNKVGNLSSFRFVPLPGRFEQNGYHEDLTLDPSRLPFIRQKVESGELALCISGDVLQQLVTAIVERSTESFVARIKDEKQVLLHPNTQSVLRDVVPLISVFARHAPRQKEAIVAAFNLGGYYTQMCGDGTNDVGALRRAHVGISLISAPEVEAKQRSAARTISQMKAERKKEGKKKGSKRGSSSKSSLALETSLRQLQEAQDELEQVELGDASIASPFTSRMVSIKCCKEVLQQGRCALVTMLQIYKILGVNCLVNAMILSKLFLHGVKQGDRQLTVLGIVVAGLFFFVTRGKPLPTLSTVHPPTSVLCSQALISISTQFVVHYTSMLVATEVALSFVDPYDPSMIPDGPFNANILNTCTFLISTLATVNTFAVNYRGEPFVEPMRKNKMLWRTLQLCYGVLLVCTLEIFPPLNDLLQLSEFPQLSESEAVFSTTKSGMSVLEKMSFHFVERLAHVVQSIGFPIFMSGLMICDSCAVFLLENQIRTFYEGFDTVKRKSNNLK